MILETLQNLSVYAFGNADDVLVSELEIAFLLYHLYEFICAYLAKGALLGSGITFMNITANCAFPLFHSCNLLN